MKKFMFSAWGAMVALVLFLGSTPAFAQSSPNLTYGQVPTAGQWNGFFMSKQDVLGYTPLNQAGGTMTGKLNTVAPTTSGAGFSILPGVAPNVPANGDIWLTSAGLYYRANNITIGPIGSGTINGPTTTVVGNVAKWGNTSGTLLTDGGALGTAAIANTGTSGHTLGFLDGANTWSAAQAFSSLSAATPIPVASGGTGGATQTAARSGIGAAASGSNSDITSISGLTTALSVAQGGTGAITPSAARTSLSAASSGANSDITSIAGLTTALSIGQGGTGSTTASAARTALGLGSIATQNANAVAITGGSVTGASVSGLSSAIAITDGGTGATTAANARTNLGLTSAATATTVVNGTWTPVLQFGGGSTGITYSVQSGRYTRIGSMVLVSANITLTSKGTSTGSASITGLPIAAAGSSSFNYALQVVASGTSGITSLCDGNLLGGSSSISLATGTGATSVTDANLTNTSIIFLSGVYDVGSL